MRRPFALVIILSALLAALPRGSEAAVTLEDMRKVAAYSEALNTLIAGLGAIYEQATEYDGLAEAAVSKQVAPDDTDRRVALLSARLRSRYGELSAALDKAPPPPDIADAQLRTNMENTRRMATASREIALEAIEAGEELVRAARQGDANFYQQRTLKNLRLVRSQLSRQSSIYQAQIANETQGSVNFHLYAVMAGQSDVMAMIIDAAIGRLDGAKIAAEFYDPPRSLIAQGRQQLGDARAAYAELVGMVERAGVTEGATERNKRVVLEALATVPQSIEVEAQIFDELETYLKRMQADTLDDGAIDIFQLRVSDLERRRATLLIERQKKIQNLSGG